MRSRILSRIDPFGFWATQRSHFVAFVLRRFAPLMNKRFVVICLVALLCIPCLGVVVCADTIEQFDVPLSFSSDINAFSFDSSFFVPGKYSISFYAYKGDVATVGYWHSVEFVEVYEDDLLIYVYDGPMAFYVSGSYVVDLNYSLAVSPDLAIGYFTTADGSSLGANYDSYSMTFTRIPDVGDSPITVLIDCISSFLLGVIAWLGVVIGAVLAPDGVLSALWPLIGLGLCIALVYAGVGLIRRFSP